MTGWVGTPSGKKEISGLWVGTTSGKKEVDLAWVGDANGVPQLWYQRWKPITLDAVAQSWHTIRLTWTNTGGERYVITNMTTGGTVYDGPWVSSRDNTGLTENKRYDYKVEGYKNGRLFGDGTDYATTGPLPAFSMSAADASWSQIDLTWTNISEAGWTYKLTRTTTNTVLYGPGAWKSSHADTGLSGGTRYDYKTEAIFGGVVKLTATAGDTTQNRPTSGGCLTYGTFGYYSWTGDTTLTLSGPTFDPNVNGWVTSFNLCVHGDTTNAAANGRPSTGRFDPFINGWWGGERNVGAQAYKYKGWTGVTGSTGATCFDGNNTIGFKVPQNTNDYTTQWYAYDSAYNSHSTWKDICYEFYVSRENDDSMRKTPWWNEILAEREIHIEQLIGEDNKAVKVQVYDKATGKLLVDWEREDYREQG